MVFHSGNCLNNKKPFANPADCVSMVVHIKAISEHWELDEKNALNAEFVCMSMSKWWFCWSTNEESPWLLTSNQRVSLNCPETKKIAFEIPCLGILDRDSWITFDDPRSRKKSGDSYGRMLGMWRSQACASSVQVFKQVHNDWLKHPAIQIHVHTEDGWQINQTLREDTRANSANSDQSKLGWRKRAGEK